MRRASGLLPLSALVGMAPEKPAWSALLTAMAFLAPLATASARAVEPVVSTPTITATAGAEAARCSTVVPASGTWINQQQLIDGQRNDLSVPLTLSSQNPCFKAWKQAGHGLKTCS